jgi:hypothetical protein
MSHLSLFWVSLERHGGVVSPLFRARRQSNPYPNLDTPVARCCDIQRNTNEKGLSQMNTHVDRLWTERVTVGKGQYHIQTTHNRKGELNTHRLAGKPYTTAGLKDIIELAQNPQICEKAEACWMLASTYNQPDARTFSVQTELGVYVYLLVDIDKGNKSLADVVSAISTVLPSTFALINSTISATPDNRKWHITIPMSKRTNFDGFTNHQLVLFRRLEEQGLTVDHTLARPAQLFFLPSKKAEDAYYEHTTVAGDPCVIGQGGILYAETSALFMATKAEKQLELNSTKKGIYYTRSIIAWFNQTHSTETIMEHYGYTFDGKEWASPYQQHSSDGKRFSTMVREDGNWFSFSDNDAREGLGIPTSGGRHGDAFELMKRFAFRGNERAAIQWALAERQRVGVEPIPQNVTAFVAKLLGGSDK